MTPNTVSTAILCVKEPKLAAAGGEGPCVDIMEISKPDDLGGIANLGLTLAEAKQLLARVQREISTAQARKHAVRRPVCPCRDAVRSDNDEAAPVSLCRVRPDRDRHQLAVALPLDTGTGPAPGTPVRTDDVPGER